MKACSKQAQKSSQQEYSSRKEIKMQHFVGDFKNQDIQVEEES